MYEVIEKIDKKAPIYKDILKMLKGTRTPGHVRYHDEILFLENSSSLDSCAENLRRILIDLKIPHNCLYNISDLPWEYIKEQIYTHNVLAFQTTGTYEITRTITKHLFEVKEKKKIIECYISEPKFIFKPEGIPHDVWILNSACDTMTDWKYCKQLREDKGYWEK